MMKSVLLSLLLTGLACAQSYLGVNLRELLGKSGVEVTRVASLSPAEAAGLKPGDVITQFNGETVRGTEHFAYLVNRVQPGSRVPIEIQRGDTQQTITARIGSPPPPATSVGGVPGARDPRIIDEPQTFQGWRNPVLGVQVQELEGQLADYFGVTQGLLVHLVAAGSAAARAGIKAGDVITGVGSAKVSTVADLTNRLRLMPGNSIGLTVMRNRQSVSLPVTFEIQCTPVRGATC
jgi:serine protease Do